LLEQKHILLATLGGQPQVVTFTLDLLLARYPITNVIALHPKATQERLQHSLACLQKEFVGDIYSNTGRAIHFRSQTLSYKGRPLDDIVDDMHADGVLDTIHQLIGELKRQDYCIHLSVSGGRRLIALLATSVAALNFDRHDHIWHIYTPDELQEQASNGKIMHIPQDAGVKLIQGPFLSLGSYIYHPSSSFRTAQHERRTQMDAQDHTACHAVFNEATSSQRKVLQGFARGLRPQQVAHELDISLATVHSHKTVLLRLCINAWNIPPQERLDYHFLQVKFASFIEDDE